MAERKFTEDHEWIELNGDLGTVGITSYAQEQLGDVVFVELPEVGRKVHKGKDMAVVESVKAASEVYAPVSGEVVEVNERIVNEPATVNSDAEGKAWFVKLRMVNPSELDGLMTAEGYSRYVEGLK